MISVRGRVIAMDAGFNESDHPRDAGKFSTKSGGKKSSAQMGRSKKQSTNSGSNTSSQINPKTGLSNAALMDIIKTTGGPDAQKKKAAELFRQGKIDKKGLSSVGFILAHPPAPTQKPVPTKSQESLPEKKEGFFRKIGHGAMETGRFFASHPLLLLLMSN